MAWREAVLQDSGDMDDDVLDSFHEGFQVIAEDVAEASPKRGQRMGQPAGRDQEAGEGVAAVARGLRIGLEETWGIAWYKLVFKVCRDFVARMGFNPPAGSIARSMGCTRSRAGASRRQGPSHPAAALNLADIGGLGGSSPSSSSDEGGEGRQGSHRRASKDSALVGYIQAQTAAMVQLVNRPETARPEALSRKPVGEVRQLAAQQGAFKAHEYRTAVTHWMTLNHDLLSQKQGMRMQAIQVASSSSTPLGRIFLRSQMPELEGQCPGSGMILLTLLQDAEYGTPVELEALSHQVQSVIDLQAVPPRPRQLLQLYASLVQKKYGIPTPEELQLAYELRQGVKTSMHAGVGTRE